MDARTLTEAKPAARSQPKDLSGHPGPTRVRRSTETGSSGDNALVLRAFEGRANDQPGLAIDERHNRIERC